MNSIKKSCSSLALLCLLTLAAFAQESGKSLTYPQLFIGLQGGGQTTLTDYNNCKLLTPTASFSIGSFFTPVVGARLHLNGIWNKGGYKDESEDFKYRYKYLTSDVDLLVNLVTLIGKKSYYPVNVYLIGGVGLNYAWDNGDAFARTDKMPIAYESKCFSHNARLGTQIEWNISKHVGINLEVAANNLKDRYNSKVSEKGDWQLTAQLGVAYKFRTAPHRLAQEGVTKKKSTRGDSDGAEVWETRKDTIWYDEVLETPKDVDGTTTWTVFYDTGKSDFEASEQLTSIGAFLKNWRNCKVDVKSYADAKTGNAQKNMELSKQRCEKAVKALVDAGVPSSAITSNYYGDTIQPFAENDKNRVTIIVASGQRDGIDKKTVRKFKTKDVRYRVR